MIRATTPLQEFTFEQNPADFTKILITYSQDDNIILEKNKNNLSFDTVDVDGVTMFRAYFRMSQAEANLFEPGACRVQVRVLTSSGEALASDITNLKVTDVLNDEVLT